MSLMVGPLAVTVPLVAMYIFDARTATDLLCCSRTAFLSMAQVVFFLIVWGWNSSSGSGFRFPCMAPRGTGVLLSFSIVEQKGTVPVLENGSGSSGSSFGILEKGSDSSMCFIPVTYGWSS